MGKRTSEGSQISRKERMKDNYKIAIRAAIEAGKKIMEIYKNDDYDIEQKKDDSPLTVADRESNKIINAALIRTRIPIISEENDQIPYDERKKWTECWIVDPLDGTKEFIKRNGEFTVNIAFVKNGKPEFGVIYAPDLNLLYYGIVQEGKAYRLKVAKDMATDFIVEESEEITPNRKYSNYRVVGSRSHMNEDTKRSIEELRSQEDKEVEVISRGSSLKFCLMAEGEANIYPRFGPTMEWDTAAGQAICEAVGLSCVFNDTKNPVSYNRKNLLNGNFIVSHER